MQRPTSVTVFGILNIIFAVIGFVGILISTVFLFMSGSNNPALRIMHENPLFLTWMKLMLPLGILADLVLLAAGIGLLSMKRWGRQASIGYAIYAIATGVLGMAIHFFIMVRPLLQEAGRAQGPEAFGAIGGAIGGTIGGCFSLAYPIVLLIFMLRPNMAAAFENTAARTETNYPTTTT